MTGQTPGSAEGGLKQVYVTGLTETSLTDLEGVGTIRFENKRWYKWVKYDEGAAALDIVAGDVLVYDAVSGYGASRVTADVSDGDVIPIGAGVAVGTVTVTATYMWMQIKGLATLALDVGGSSPDDGERITASLNGGTNKIAINNPDLTQLGMGASLDDTAKTVLLDCPF